MLDVTYAVCAKICIPAHGAATLILTLEGSRGATSIRSPAWLAKVPHWRSRYRRSIGPDDQAETSPSLTMAPKQGHRGITVKDRAGRLTWAGKMAIDDIFADAPEGFYFDTRKRGPEHLERSPPPRASAQPGGKSDPGLA